MGGVLDVTDQVILFFWGVREKASRKWGGKREEGRSWRAVSKGGVEASLEA